MLLMKQNVLDLLINNLPQYIWWKDLNSVFLGCNEKTANFVGLKSAKEIIGKTDFDIYDTKSDAEFVRKIDKEIMTTGIPQFNFEKCLTMPVLGKRWLSTSKIPWYNDNNEIIGTIGWFTDITARKEIELELDEKNKTLIKYNHQLKQTNKALELANIDLEKFTYAASHDLKTPVQTMKSFVNLLKLKEQDNLQTESNEYINILNNSADRMLELIDGLLSYAKSGSKQLESEDVNVHQIVSEKIIDLKSVIESKSAKIKLNLPTKKIKAYSQLIGSVFFNLISNGIKFNTSSMPTIECDYTEEQDYWVFNVKDNGDGIDPKYKDQIFQPFKRLADQSIQGSGLGLSICKRIVSLHDGEIWLKDSMKGTTVFSFSVSKSL